MLAPVLYGGDMIAEGRRGQARSATKSCPGSMGSAPQTCWGQRELAVFSWSPGLAAGWN